MGTFLFGLVVGGNLAWVFIELRRNSVWRKFNARRRGGKVKLGANEITEEEWEAMRTPIKRKPPAKETIYGWGPCQLEPPRPAPGEIFCNPKTMEWCGLPWDEGIVQRGNGHGGTTTPKPLIKPKPSGGRILKPWE